MVLACVCLDPVLCKSQNKIGRCTPPRLPSGLVPHVVQEFSNPSLCQPFARKESARERHNDYHHHRLIMPHNLRRMRHHLPINYNHLLTEEGKAPQGTEVLGPSPPQSTTPPRLLDTSWTTGSPGFVSSHFSMADPFLPTSSVPTQGHLHCTESAILFTWTADFGFLNLNSIILIPYIGFRVFIFRFSEI